MNAPEDDATVEPAVRAEPAEPARRPYAKPTLVAYGDVVALTENVGFSGKSDGGKGFRRRTR